MQRSMLTVGEGAVCCGLARRERQCVVPGAARASN